jgi:hypothetical protein
VKPVTDQYGVGFLSLHGYSSATLAHDVAELSVEDERPLIIYYLGDWDRSGMHMSERDLPERLRRYGGAAKVQWIALAYHDVYSTRLPSFPTEDKHKDPRYRWYVEEYGGLCWELDALNPNILRERVERHIRSLIDWHAWERCTKVEQAERASLMEVVGAWKGAQR